MWSARGIGVLSQVFVEEEKWRRGEGRRGEGEKRRRGVGERGALFLAVAQASKKWKMPIKDWKSALSRFIIEFEEQLEPHLQ
jgi:hypothetical protein